jgi:hypothetical protein
MIITERLSVQVADRVVVVVPLAAYVHGPRP